MEWKLYDRTQPGVLPFIGAYLIVFRALRHRAHRAALARDMRLRAMRVQSLPRTDVTGIAMEQARHLRYVGDVRRRSLQRMNHPGVFSIGPVRRLGACT